MRIEEEVTRRMRELENPSPPAPLPEAGRGEMRQCEPEAGRGESEEEET
jgi:hypothetical protein